ncbi:actin-related protein 10 isoform X2 [Erinaceus europaeus]|uniref:Actin-related protein 10 isoform X2 n=1 Tax=Erinaceus europaeus TaxID=9365 RepID=A0ABM3W2U6_ERIEU|nr:actin-related protein 10 isoform X2 [Erinaceus europaeus]
MRSVAPAPAATALLLQRKEPFYTVVCRLFTEHLTTMPLYEGLGSGGEKTAVVIDLGEAFTKCGFAGETGPRCIIPSVIKRAGVSKPIKVVQYNINTEELYSYLKEFIHILYFRHLLVNPRDRRVVVIESVLCPSHFRETLTRVLFKYFEVPSVLLAPSHLMALLTLGINSAMVLDCGYRESLVLPIYEGIPVLNCWGALPLGGKALHKELETQLLEQCTVDTSAAKEQNLPSVMGSIPEGILEDIKVRTCFVSDLKRGLNIQAAKFNIDGNTERPSPPPNVDYPLDGEKILHVLGSIRDSVVEILFEQDNEEKSVATLILDSLLQELFLEHCKTYLGAVQSQRNIIIRQAAYLIGVLLITHLWK